MINWCLGEDVDVDTMTVLKDGFHPMSVKGRPNALRLHLTMPGMDRVGRGTIETDWDGKPLCPPLHIRTRPRPTFEAAIEAMIRKWERIVKYVKTGELDRSVRTIVDELVDAKSPTRQEPLEEGEYIAYFIPDIPVEFQTHFIITQVTGTNPLTLANGHHETVFKSGRGHVSRYDPVENRIVFPVVDIRKVQ